jgi:transposase
LYELALIPEENRVYIDEAGSNLGMAPLCAWAPINERAYDKKPSQRGENISLVGALKKSGMQELYPYDGSVDAERFADFIENKLKPHLKAGDVLIMDNCRTHHALLLKEKLKELSLEVLYLPPYSPELNPIEECWSVIKGHLKRIKARNISDYVKGIFDAKKAIDGLKGAAFFRHAASFGNFR